MGTVPASLAEFSDLRLYLGGNNIDEIAPEVCDKSDWMDGLMATGCDALLCPIGTYNSRYGRRTPLEDCKVCDHTTMIEPHFGNMICQVEFPDIRDDRSMLEEMYDFANGDEWTNNDNWKNPDSSICDWFGITCDTEIEGEDRVAEISLPSNNLIGALGSVVFALPRLRELDVSGNDIHMTFRDVGAAVTLEAINVKAISSIDLEGLGKATSLKELRLSDNDLFGQTFPSGIYELSDLQLLEVANAGFSGSLEDGLAQLSELQIFNASDNELEDIIPDVFENFAKLQVVDLRNNNFHGTVPLSLQSCQLLEFLDLSGHEAPANRIGLGGPLPVFSSSPLMAYIDLGGNSFTGTVPSDFLAGVANAKTAEVTVLLNSNILHGAFPADVSSRFGNGLEINLVDNEIESIPESLCSTNSFGCDGVLCPAGTYNEDGRKTSEDNPCVDCPGQDSLAMGQIFCASATKKRNREILEIFFEKTEGSKWNNKDGWLDDKTDICDWFGITCRDGFFVETIDLIANNLVNTPPKEIFEIAGLRELWLNSNPIEFKFEGIENARELRDLRLDSTNLQSLKGMGIAPALTYLDIRFNGLTGTFPSDELEGLTELETLIISENAYSGQLPRFRGNKKLTTLSASSNAFVGPLPALDVHPLIQRVDVAKNQLFGAIPDSFLKMANTSKTIVVDIAGNKLLGVLPGSLSRFAEMSLYAQDNRFTGIDPKLCNMKAWNRGNVGEFDCDGILCPPKTFALQGRASSEGDCQHCPNSNDAPFFGHSTCHGGAGLGQDGTQSTPSSAATLIRRITPLWISSSGLLLLFLFLQR